MSHGTGDSPRLPIRFTVEQLFDAIDHMADGTMVVDGAGRITYASGQVAELFGYVADELIGTPIELLVPQEQRARHRRARGLYARTPKVRPMGGPLDIEGLRRDGSLVPVDVWLAPLGDGSVLVNVRDMTETRQRDASRAAELARLRQAQERERAALVTHDMVLQRLFGIAAGLQAITASVDPTTATALTNAIELIDDTIISIRHEAFGGGRPTAAPGAAATPPWPDDHSG